MYILSIRYRVCSFHLPNWSLQIYINFSADCILICEHRFKYGSVFPPRSGANVVSSKNSVCSTTLNEYSVPSSASLLAKPQYSQWSLFITCPLKSAALSNDRWSLWKSSSAGLTNLLQRQLFPTPTRPTSQWQGWRTSYIQYNKVPSNAGIVLGTSMP